MQTKTQYVIDKKPSGIMFWQLMGDTFNDGLLDAIDAVRNPLNKIILGTLPTPMPFACSLIPLFTQMNILLSREKTFN